MRSWQYRMSGIRPPLSLNGREHRMARAKITAAIREEASWRTRANVNPEIKPTKVRVEIFWLVSDGRRRDEDNPAPSAKAVYDGIVDAGLVPDDTPQYMTKMSVRIIQDKLNPAARGWYVRITEETP